MRLHKLGYEEMFDWDSIATTYNEDSASADLLPHMGYSFWEIIGPDAETFLQGQLTNDLSLLGEKEMCFAAHCNPKGRVVSLFQVAKISTEHFVLKLPSALAQIATQQLKKYMVFSKAELSEIEALSLSTKPGSHRNALGKSAIAQHTHSDGSEELWVVPTEAAAYLQSGEISLASGSAWKRRLITLGIPEIGPEQSEQYLPQELNLDLIGAVNFKKGCYTGQEIIARLHYRGKSKKRLRRGIIKKEHTKLAEIASDAGSKLGEVVNIQANSGTSEFLANVSIDCHEHSCLLKDDSDTIKIEWLELPYAIPVE